MIQTTNNHPDEPTCREISAETIKMPDPIIEPATSIVESSKPSPLTNLSSAVGGGIMKARQFEYSDFAELIIIHTNRATPKHS